MQIRNRILGVGLASVLGLAILAAPSAANAADHYRRSRDDHRSNAALLGIAGVILVGNHKDTLGAIALGAAAVEASRANDRCDDRGYDRRDDRDYRRGRGRDRVIIIDRRSRDRDRNCDDRYGRSRRDRDWDRDRDRDRDCDNRRDRDRDYRRDRDRDCDGD